MAKITPELLEEIRLDVEKSLIKVGQKYGIIFDANSGSYESTGWAGSLRLNMEVVTTEEGISVNQARFEKYCSIFGISKDDYQAELEIGGKTYTIEAINVKARKNPLQIKCKETGEWAVLPLEVYHAAKTLNTVRQEEHA